jgi:hypothetical protein
LAEAKTMAGFFGLFGGRTKYVGEPDPATETKEAFFLEPDAAKSLGDVEFMRKPITIKRSFPKTLKGKGTEVVQQVSALEKIEVKGQGAPVPPQSTKPPEPQEPQRRTAANDLDPFRQMAKDIGRKG